MKRFLIIFLCIILIASVPLLCISVFCNTLSYEMPDATQMSYMDVITNEYAYKSYPDSMLPIDKELNSALNKYKFKPVKFSDAISILYTTDENNAEKLYIYHGNFELIYINGRKFFYGYLIFTENKTYFFAEYSGEKEVFEIPPNTKTLYELQGEKPLDINDFQHIESENTKLLSKWISDRFEVTYARIANSMLNNTGKSVVIAVVYIFLSGMAVYLIKDQKSKNKQTNKHMQKHWRS